MAFLTVATALVPAGSALLPRRPLPAPALLLAAGLFISTAAVRAHVTRLLAKLDARDRVQLVTIAYEAGLAPSSR